ncbi:MAG TPA: hypothetical protein PKU97_23585, partial [Kofleriaceae bacterium]|nr:hypothetical protein [Kofleriaceae bacterium]
EPGNVEFSTAQISALEEARAGLQACLDWFTEGHDTADLRHASALLELGLAPEPPATSVTPATQERAP